MNLKLFFLVAIIAVTVFSPSLQAGLGLSYEETVKVCGPPLQDLGTFHGVEGSRYFLFYLPKPDVAYDLAIGAIYTGNKMSAVNYVEIKDGEFLPIQQSMVDFILTRSDCPGAVWLLDPITTAKVGGINWTGTVDGVLAYRVNLTDGRTRLTVMTQAFFSTIKELTPSFFAMPAEPARATEKDKQNEASQYRNNIKSGKWHTFKNGED